MDVVLVLLLQSNTRWRRASSDYFRSFDRCSGLLMREVRWARFLRIPLLVVDGGRSPCEGSGRCDSVSGMGDVQVYHCTSCYPKHLKMVVHH